MQYLHEYVNQWNEIQTSAHEGILDMLGHAIQAATTPQEVERAFAIYRGAMNEMQVMREKFAETVERINKEVSEKK